MNPQLIVTIAITIINLIVLLTVKLNDLKHLQLRMERLSDLIDELFSKVEDLKERVARIEGILSRYDN